MAVVLHPNDEAYPSRLGELHGVLDKVKENLAYSRRIRLDGHRNRSDAFDLELKVLLFSADPHNCCDVGYDFDRRANDAFDREHPRLDLGDVEDVVEDRQEVSSVASDGVDSIYALRCRVPSLGAGGEYVGESENDRHRRTNLVTHVGEKLALGATGCVGQLLGTLGLAFRLA